MKDPQFDSYAGQYKDVVKLSTGIIPVQDDFYLKAKIDMLTEMIAQLPKNARILDFGCGVGGLTVPLSRLHPDKKFFAFDVSPQSIARIKEQKLSNVTCMSTEEQLISNELKSTVDFIFCINVFHHIDRKDRTATVGLLKHLLISGGKFLILEHNPINPLTRLVVSRCEFDEGVELLGKGELTNLMKNNSLEVSRHWYVLFFPVYNKVITALEKLISFMPLGAQHCILAIKK